MDVWAVVTSAAVGALVSTAINVVSQWRERSARRRELLFRAAMELAHKRQELFVSEALRTRTPLLVPDPVFNIAEYFDSLEHLFDKGKLPAELHAKQESSAQWQALKTSLAKKTPETPPGE